MKQTLDFASPAQEWPGVDGVPSRLINDTSLAHMDLSQSIVMEQRSM